MIIIIVTNSATVGYRRARVHSDNTLSRSLSLSFLFFASTNDNKRAHFYRLLACNSLTRTVHLFFFASAAACFLLSPRRKLHDPDDGRWPITKPIRVYVYARTLYPCFIANETNDHERKNEKLYVNIFHIYIFIYIRNNFFSCRFPS